MKYKLFCSTHFDNLEKQINSFTLDEDVVSVQLLSHGGFICALIAYQEEKEE